MMQRESVTFVLSLQDAAGAVLLKRGKRMRSMIITLVLALGMAISASAQGVDSVNVKAGKQAVARHSKLTIRFLDVVEDSRCPTGTNCIWAGNAKIRIEVSHRGGGSQTFEINTNMGPKGDQYDGWAIDLVSLTPVPNAKCKTDPKRYIATFTVTRLQR